MASRRIEDLQQKFQPMVRELLTRGNAVINATGYKLFITDGFRSFAEQTELYAQGRTKPGPIVTQARAGESPHNYGLAVDLAFQKNGELSYAANLYKPVYEIARQLGFVLGADWTGFVDVPHFEYPNWRSNIASTNAPAAPAPVTGDQDMSHEEFYKKFIEAFEKHRNDIEWGDDKNKPVSVFLEDPNVIGRMFDEVARSYAKVKQDLANAQAAPAPVIQPTTPPYINEALPPVIVGWVANGLTVKVGDKEWNYKKAE